MILDSQKYRNTSRTITGLSNNVFTSDVLIFCDTSTGAVALNLLEIPTDFWNTTYKLYVVDANNNAQTNNITINAPVGFQVNNALSFVISTNGGIALIRIVNNTDYLAELNYNASALAVLNEGVLLTPNATSMDFIGSYVNATNVGSAVSVFIQPSIISITYAQLQTAITNSTLIAGQMYEISNAIFIQTTSETAPVYLIATSTNTISAQGQGRFLNADYQGIGNYSSVTGFVSNLGVWNSSLLVVVGSVVIWNNLQYVSLTGVNNQPDINPLDWQLLSKTLTTGYILEVCTILYDVNTNSIYKRIDLNNNSVENNISTYVSVGLEAFQVFQWGAILSRDNFVGNESALNNRNNRGDVFENTIINGAIVTIFSNNSTGIFQKNIVKNCSLTAINDGNINYNNFYDSILNLGNNEGNINYNCVTNNSTIINNSNPDPQLEIIGNVISENSSLTNGVGNLFNRFKNNNLQNKAVVILDPLGDPFPLLGEISENHFSNCQILLGVFLVTDILSGNVFNGFVGQVFNFRGFFKNNSFLSSPNYVYNLNNSSGGTPANFNENQLNFCNADIINASNFNENLAEYSEVIITYSDNSIRNNSIRNSTFTITQNQGTIDSNNIEDSTFNFFNVNVGVSIRYNELRNLTTLSVINCNNNITSNEFQNFIFSVGTNNCNFSLNQVFSGQLISPTLSTTQLRNIFGVLFINSTGIFAFSIGGGIIQPNVVTTQVRLDISDPTIYDLPTQTLTIPSVLEFVCGIIALDNGTAPITITKIIGGLTGSTPSAMKFINETGFNVDFSAVAVGVAVANDIISNLAPNTYTLVDRISGADSIYIRRLGAFCGVEQVYIYI
jgi:hypothetical protein